MEELLKQQTAQKRQDEQESIFEGYSAGSLLFEVILAIAIIGSVVVVLLETNKAINAEYGAMLLRLEWMFTILFSVEYLLRVITAKKRIGYIFSFFGMIDFVSVLPTYISVFIHKGQLLEVIRLLRLLRVFSRLIKFSHEFHSLSASVFGLKHHLSSNEKIIMFFTPSRKRWVLRYLLVTGLAITSIVEIVFNFLPTINVLGVSVLSAISYAVLLICLVILFKTEYKIWSERYMMTNQRLLYSKGMLHEHFQSKTYQYITDVSLHQSMWDKMINTGDLVITTASGEGDELRINDVSDPLRIKRIINENMQTTARQTQNTYNIT